MAEEFDNLSREEAGQNAPAPEKKTRPGFGLFEWLQMFVGCVLLAVICFNCLIRVTLVQGDSMLPTLHTNELLLVWDLGYQPEQGDIVVLNKMDAGIPGWNGQRAIVKRIIATGGQSVHLDYETSTVYVDGVPLDEPYIREAMQFSRNSYMQQTHWQVPEGCVFVMGDNRNDSTDSRHQQVGCVEEEFLLGKAVLRLWPLNVFGAL